MQVRIRPSVFDCPREDITPWRRERAPAAPKGPHRLLELGEAVGALAEVSLVSWPAYRRLEGYAAV